MEIVQMVKKNQGEQGDVFIYIIHYIYIYIYIYI